MAPTRSRSSATSSSSSALIRLPPCSLVLRSFYVHYRTPYDYLGLAPHQQRQQQQQQRLPIHSQLVLYKSQALSLPLPSPRSSVPLLLLLPPSPPHRSRARLRADNCTVALCFRYLDYPSLFQCRRVCRLWWRQSNLRIVGEGRGWPEVARRRPRVDGAEVKERDKTFGTTYVRALCHSLPFLRSLDLSKADKLSRSEGMTEAALSAVARLSSLTSLQLSHQAAAVTDRSALHLTKLRHLRLLNLSACRALTSQALHYLEASPVARSLTSLELSSCPLIADVSNLRGFPHLTSLNLNDCRRLDFSSLSSLASLPLRSLALQSTHVTAASLSFLRATPSSSLTSLDCSACPDLDDSLATLLPHLGALKVLKLSDCPALSPLFLPTLAASLPSPLSSLLYLDLSKSPLVVTDASLPSLSFICPSLQILSLAQCSDLTTTAPLASLTSLHSLDLNLCRQLRSLAALPSLPLLTLRLWDCALLGDTQLTPLMRCDWLMDLNACSSGVGEESVSLWKQGGMKRLRRLNVRFCAGLSVYARGELREARHEVTLID